MVMLDRVDFERCQSFIESIIDEIEALGLTVKIDNDLYAWRAILDTTGNKISKALDPELNDIRTRDGFWISFVDAQDRVVCCAGARLIETPDFIQYMVANHRLFGDRVPKLRFERITFENPPRHLSGRIGFGGGSWTHPKWRRRNFSGKISRIWRTICVRDQFVDYCAATTELTDKRADWVIGDLGWTDRAHLLTGGYPGREAVENVQILWCSAQDVIDISKQELPQKYWNLKAAV